MGKESDPDAVARFLDVVKFRVAKQFLEGRGYRFLETNWTCDEGSSMDVIAEEGNTIVFVTIRANLYNPDSPCYPDISLDVAKAIEVAFAYLTQASAKTDHNIGFDVLSILVVSSDTALIKQRRLRL